MRRWAYVGQEAEEGQANHGGEDADGHDDVVVHEEVLEALVKGDGLRLSRLVVIVGLGQPVDVDGEVEHHHHVLIRRVEAEVWAHGAEVVQLVQSARRSSGAVGARVGETYTTR